MVDIINSGFYNFVRTLPENVMKKIIWDQYFGMKAESGIVPAMKKGAAEFAAICLLREYSAVMKYEGAVRQCNYIFYQIFQYTPPEVINTTMKNVIANLDCGVSYGEYADVTDYMKKNYGKWLGEMEFSKGREDFNYEEAYEQFQNTTASALKGWEDVQRNADETGLAITILKSDTSLNRQTEDFFDSQSRDAENRYAGYEGFDEKNLYEAYRTLEVIPFKTAYVYHLAVSMEKKLEENSRKAWEEKLKQFQEAVGDRQIICGRVTYGDNEFKVKQVENSFVNSGKFEHILLINDTSKRMNGREGMAVTTESLYYKGRFSSGEIKIRDISHFEFSGSMFSQGLTVHTLGGKKYPIPCNVGKTEHYKYLRVLEELLRVIKTEIHT